MGAKIQNQVIIDNKPIYTIPPPKILKSICKISYEFNGQTKWATGFLIKFYKNDKDFFCLMTNEHVITKDMVEKKIKITCYYDSERKFKEIHLNSAQRYIKSFKNDFRVDATVIEIISSEIPLEYFLLPSLEYMDKFNDLINKEISVIQYPGGEKISFSNGTIKEINKYQFTHSAWTKEGSSGSPIFLKDETEVIGMHKSGKDDNSEHYGDFIGPIYDYLKNKKESKKEPERNNEEHNENIITIPPPEILKSICKIEYILNEKTIKATGFLIKFFKGDKDFYCLMTNEHIINKEIVEQKKMIKFYYDNEDESKEIYLNSDERYIKMFKEELDIDATVVEILQKDKIDKEYFLLPLLEYMDNITELKNKIISIIQYPSGGKIGFSNGIIKEINKNEITHLASTKGGSSGSPIFLTDSIRVVGIHKSGNEYFKENYGDFIGPIFNFFKKGEIKINIRRENGIEYFSNSTNIFYGNSENYKANRKEKIIYKNNEYYIGEIKNNLKHGKGKIYCSNGNIKFEGNFINDKAEGNGKFIYENGNYYIGEFKNGLKNGNGKVYYANGKIKYDGKFVNDKAEGDGKYIYINNDYYIGQFKNDLKHGKGIMFYSDDNIAYDGDFVNGKYEGNGKYIYKNGEYYIGKFKNGLRHGKGKLYHFDGNIKYEGNFINDKFQGN